MALNNIQNIQKLKSLQHLQTIQKLQNMSYGIYRYNKSKICCFRFFPQQIESILVFLVCFVQSIVILNIGFGFFVFFCIWEHTLKIFYDIFRPQKLKNVRHPKI